MKGITTPKFKTTRQAFNPLEGPNAGGSVQNVQLDIDDNGTLTFTTVDKNNRKTKASLPNEEFVSIVQNLRSVKKDDPKALKYQKGLQPNMLKNIKNLVSNFEVHHNLQDVTSVLSVHEARLYADRIIGDLLCAPNDDDDSYFEQRPRNFKDVENVIEKAFQFEEFGIHIVPSLVFELIRYRKHHEDEMRAGAVYFRDQVYYSCERENMKLVEKCLSKPEFSKFLRVKRENELEYDFFVSFLYCEKAKRLLKGKQKKRQIAYKYLTKAREAMKKRNERGDKQMKRRWTALLSDVYLAFSEYYSHSKSYKKQLEFVYKSLKEMRLIKVEDSSYWFEENFRDKITHWCEVVQSRNQFLNGSTSENMSEFVTEYIYRDKIGRKLFKLESSQTDRLVNNTDSFKNLGLCFQSLGKSKKAIEMLECGVRQNEEVLEDVDRDGSPNNLRKIARRTYKYEIMELKTLICQVLVETGKFNEKFNKNCQEAMSFARILNNKAFQAKLKKLRKKKRMGVHKKGKKKRVKKYCGVCADLKCRLEMFKVSFDVLLFEKMSIERLESPQKKMCGFVENFSDNPQ